MKNEFNKLIKDNNNKKINKLKGKFIGNFYRCFKIDTDFKKCITLRINYK